MTAQILWHYKQQMWGTSRFFNGIARSLLTHRMLDVHNCCVQSRLLELYHNGGYFPKFRRIKDSHLDNKINALKRGTNGGTN